MPPDLEQTAVAPAATQQGEGTAPVTESTELKQELDPGDFATRFADLNRKSRRMLDEQRKLKAEKEKHAQDLATLEEYRAAKENGRKDPVSLLKSLGLTYDDITKIILNDNKLTPEQQIKQLQDELEADRKARESEKTQSASAREQEVIDAAKNDIKSHVEAQSDKYELIQSEGAHDMVFEVIEEFFNEYGKIPDLDLACQHVEDYLTEKAKKIMGLKKFATPKGDTASNDKPAERQKTADSFTITNQATAAPVQTRKEYLSDAESKRAAAQLLRWN